MSSASSCEPFSLMSAIAILAPKSANARAAPLPSPLAPPVQKSVLLSDQCCVQPVMKATPGSSSLIFAVERYPDMFSGLRRLGSIVETKDSSLPWLRLLHHFGRPVCKNGNTDLALRGCETISACRADRDCIGSNNSTALANTSYERLKLHFVQPEIVIGIRLRGLA